MEAPKPSTNQLGEADLLFGLFNFANLDFRKNGSRYPFQFTNYIIKLLDCLVNAHDLRTDHRRLEKIPLRQTVG